MGLREIRKRAGWPLIKAAVVAGVSEPTARLYEHDPNAIKDEQKRASLDRTYAELRRELGDAAA